ncbi:MFS transporter [Streptomyces sp. 110]|uniref:MFS transporter n=1 Tax=Streptomyces endocoffeicus TaxID=2898945 RepID=A0ABS1PKX0_9ACTN|nr:MFS transporter [Streptomyces endocoffeicus]
MKCGVAYVARPVGAAVFGHYGDKLGRKTSLTATLVLMGGATLGIAALPTYGSIGLAAPVLLTFLRLCQGFGLGGEWGGATLLAVEHAPPGKRGLYGLFPQLGNPIGFFLSNAVLQLTLLAVGRDGFERGGWRVAFLIGGAFINRVADRCRRRGDARLEHLPRGHFRGAVQLPRRTLPHRSALQRCLDELPDVLGDIRCPGGSHRRFPVRGYRIGLQRVGLRHHRLRGRLDGPHPGPRDVPHVPGQPPGTHSGSHRVPGGLVSLTNAPRRAPVAVALPGSAGAYRTSSVPSR